MKEKINAFRKKLKWLDPFTYVDLLLEKYWPVKGRKTLTQEIGYNATYLVSAFVFAFILYQLFAIALQSKSPIVIVISQSMEPSLYRGDIVFIQGVNAEGLKAQEASINERINGRFFSEFGKASFKQSQASVAGVMLESIEVGGEKFFPNTQGDTIIYYSSINGEQIIHRAILKINAIDGAFLLTKGDNERTNWTFDQDCGALVEAPVIGTDTVIRQAGKNCITSYPVNVKEIDGKAALRLPLIGCVKVWVFDDLPSIILSGRMPPYYTGGIC